MGSPSGLARSLAPPAARNPATAAFVAVFLKNSRLEIAAMKRLLFVIRVRFVPYNSRARMFLYLTLPANPPDSPAGGHWNEIGAASFQLASAGSVGSSITWQICFSF